MTFGQHVQGLLYTTAIFGSAPMAFYLSPPPAHIYEMRQDYMTVEELLDEIDQNPEHEFEIDRYIFPLFNQMLNRHGFQFSVISVAPETVRCRILKKP